MTTGKLEPAVGRVLVTHNGGVWRIKAVHDDGKMDLISLRLGDPLHNTWFIPERGEWIAQDMLAVETWARLTGVKLK